jgi:hypothetical protein
MQTVEGGVPEWDGLRLAYERRSEELRALLRPGGVIDSLGDGMLDRVNEALRGEREKRPDLWPPGRSDAGPKVD